MDYEDYVKIATSLKDSGLPLISVGGKWYRYDKGVPTPNGCWSLGTLYRVDDVDIASGLRVEEAVWRAKPGYISW